jgi:hypothetical protein
MIIKCLRVEWNISDGEEQGMMFQDTILPLSFDLFSISEENTFPSDNFNGDSTLLKIMSLGIRRSSNCRSLFCCAENRFIFGRILSLSSDPSFKIARRIVHYFLSGMMRNGNEREIEWSVCEGGLKCGL